MYVTGRFCDFHIIYMHIFTTYIHYILYMIRYYISYHIHILYTHTYIANFTKIYGHMNPLLGPFKGGGGASARRVLESCVFVGFTADPLCSEAGQRPGLIVGISGLRFFPGVLNVLQVLDKCLSGEVMWPWQWRGCGAHAYFLPLLLSSLTWELRRSESLQNVSATFYFVSGFFGSTWCIWASCMLISISMVHSFSLLCSISLHE